MAGPCGVSESLASDIQSPRPYPLTWEPGMVITADTLHKTQNVGPVAFHEAQLNFRTHNNHIWLAAVEVSDA